MDFHDVFRNPKIARLARLTGDLRQCRTPEATLAVLRQGLAEIHGVTASVLLTTRGLPEGHYQVLDMQLEDGRPSERPVGAAAGGGLTEPRPVLSGGVMGAVIARLQPQLIQEVDWSPDPYFGPVLRGHASVIAVPSFDEGLPMTWAILLKKSPERFAESDLEDSLERLARIGAILRNQILARALAEAHEQIDRDARQVGQLQRALLPAELPQVAGLKIAVCYEPSGRAGGDLYDIFPLNESRPNHARAEDLPARWCVVIGDAAGHGLAAAVVMAIIQAVLRAYPGSEAQPASLLMHANRHLCAKQLGGFFTAFLGIYEPSSRRLSYANAGHPPPLLRRQSDGSVQELDGGRVYPLGIDDAETFTEAAVQLEPGDTVLCYTDGITEAFGSSKEEMFGLERLMDVLGGAPEDPAGLVERIGAAVRMHEQGQPPADDQTVVAAKVL